MLPKRRRSSAGGEVVHVLTSLRMTVQSTLLALKMVCCISAHQSTTNNIWRTISATTGQYSRSAGRLSRMSSSPCLPTGLPNCGERTARFLCSLCSLEVNMFLTFAGLQKIRLCSRRILIWTAGCLGFISLSAKSRFSRQVRQTRNCRVFCFRRPHQWLSQVVATGELGCIASLV